MRLFIGLLLAGISSCLNAQGPIDGFLKGKGILDLAPSFSVNSAKRFEGAGGQVYDVGYKGSMLSLFAEYGLSARIDLVATGAYVFTSSKNGLQDGALLLKYRPVYRQMGGAGKLGLLLGAGLAFPLANYEPTATGALGQKAVIAPLRFIVQWESPPGIFFNLTGGYNWRLDRLRDSDIAAVRQVRPDYQPRQPSNFATALFKIGFPAARYYLDAWVEGQYTRAGADYVPEVPDLPQSFGVSYLQTGGTVFYSENGKSGFYGSTGYIFGGRNTGRILRVTAGMVFKLGSR